MNSSKGSSRSSMTSTEEIRTDEQLERRMKSFDEAHRKAMREFGAEATQRAARKAEERKRRRQQQSQQQK